jgi:hypothetical protein
MTGEITFTPTEQDYANANRDWYRAALSGRRGLIRLAIPILIAMVLGGVFSWLDGDVAALPYTLAVYAFLGVAVIVLIHGTCYLSLARRSRRLFRQQKSLHHPLRFHWSDEGLTSEAVNGSGRHDWGDFHRWHDGRKTFLLFLNDRLFLFLPRHRLSDAEADDLRGLISAAGVPRF